MANPPFYPGEDDNDPINIAESLAEYGLVAPTPPISIVIHENTAHWAVFSIS